MHTLLLRLAGPMQSWGIQSRFPERDTGLEPSKSGIVGILCAALGIFRENDEYVAKISDLQMGARVDQQGSLHYDYQTAQNVRIASAISVDLETGKGLKDSVSRRYYLADAVFLVGLEGGDKDFLIELHAALQNPRWPLYLGRKAFVPSPPIYLADGLENGKDNTLREALQHYPWLGRDKKRYEKLIAENDGVMRVILDDRKGEQVRPDQPISFAKRQFAPRRIHVDWIDWPPFAEREVL